MIVIIITIYYNKRKCTGGHKLTKSQEKINQLMCMDKIKRFAKNEKESENVTEAVKYTLKIYGSNFESKHLPW